MRRGSIFFFLSLPWTAVLILVLLSSPGELSSQDSEFVTKRLRFPGEFLTSKLCRKEDAKHEEATAYKRLVRLKGVKVGHVRSMKLVEGRNHKVLTRSLRPLLFEIPEFLSVDECDHFIQLAQREHFADSETTQGKGDGYEREVFEKKLKQKKLVREKTAFCRRLLRWQYIENDEIGIQQFVRFIDKEKYIYPTIDDAAPIFRQLDLNLNGTIDRDECFNLSIAAFTEFLYEIEKLKSLPRYFIRYSESTSIPQNNSGIPFVKSLQDRIVRLTGLSKQLVEESEPIQVVRYSVFGHYNVHYDTTDQTRGIHECCACKSSDYTKCHLCRFVTIILYLNDVAKGGETAFPVADNVERYSTRNYSITLSKKCQEASLLVKPKKGTAVMWYNHILKHDGADHMGAIDWLSLHGGCDVIEGVKWIANVWLNALWKKDGKA